ncbi:MAG TPA: hypothetical protein VGA38_05225 [Candidatus Limnocylindria bacterium]
MQAAKDPASAATEKAKKRRSPAAVRYPNYGLADSVLVARVIHEQGGGVASRDRLAAFLSYSTTNSGAFLTRLASARLFDLITARGSDFVITPLAQRVLMPVYPEQVGEALVEAFFNVPLFKEIYDEHVGKQLPPEFGMKNLLKAKYGLGLRQADDAYRSLIESADTAGFFRTRNARTHLIIPQVGSRAARSTVEDQAADVSESEGSLPLSSGGGDSGGPRRSEIRPGPTDLRTVKATYVTTLIDLLREKNAKDGTLDLELMERIEKLLQDSPPASS